MTGGDGWVDAEWAAQCRSTPQHWHRPCGPEGDAVAERDDASVPPVPVYTVEVKEDGTVLLDGQPVDVPAHHTPSDAGIRAVARELRAAGVDAARVRVTHTRVVTHTSGERLLIVRADGTRVPPAPARWRRWAHAAFIAAPLVAILGVGVLSVARTTSEPEPAPPVSVSTPPGAGARFPTMAPPGVWQGATWAVPVADNSGAKILADGRLLIADSNGTLRLLDPETGEATWSGAGAPRDVTTISETTFDGRPALAAQSGQQLSFWPLDVTDRTVPATTLELEARSTVTFAGPTPLVDLEDRGIAWYDGESFQRQDLPEGHLPLVATAAATVSLNDDAIQYVQHDGSTRAVDYTTPDDADGPLSGARALTPDYALVTWTNVSAVMDLSDGSIMTTWDPVTIDTGEGAEPPLMDLRTQSAVVDQHFVSFDPERPSIEPLGSLDPTALSGSLVYGRDGDELAATDFFDISDEVDSYSAEFPPSAASASHIFVPAVEADQTLLYALPRKYGPPLLH